ncbi:MAG: radical SAM protein [Bacteroidota bacterium]
MPDRNEIRTLRPPRRSGRADRPVHFLHEKEMGTDGKIQNVNTLFLRNRECSFTCTMCDLWRDTLESDTPEGAIPAQINYALARLPKADRIKLYNSGNFFDQRAIPTTDHPDILKSIQGVQHLIVENHPLLCNHSLFRFASQFDGTFEVAMGLETIHPEILPRLNKKLSPESYRSAVHSLRRAGIHVRTFLLLQLPWELDPEENREWALRSLQFAFESGSQLVTMIPTRSGNGYMDQLEEKGLFVEPSLNQIEQTIDEALRLANSTDGHSILQVDLWDLSRFSSCLHCLDDRRRRLERINLTQQPQPHVACSKCRRDTP